MSGADGPGTRASSWGLGVLVLLALYTYADRQIIALQAEPIRQQLGLGDAQLGMVQAAGVALVTAVAGYPIGWIADRCDRSNHSGVVGAHVEALLESFEKTVHDLLLTQPTSGRNDYENGCRNTRHKAPDTSAC